MAAEKLFITRHPESLEDVDNDAYGRISDDMMPLTELGQRQATELAMQLQSMIGKGNPFHIYLSPCLRVKQAGTILTKEMTLVNCTISTIELLRKQDWGDVTMENRDRIIKERYREGVLRYQFPGGENGPQFIARFKEFTDWLTVKLRESNSPKCVGIITHGFEMRILLMLLLGWSEDYFETLAHPLNCEYKTLNITPDGLELVEEMRIHNHEITRQVLQNSKQDLTSG